MRARILCRTGQLAGSSHDLGPATSIGRGVGNDLVLHSRLISDRHARIWMEDGDWYVEDLGSLNGTTLDGEPLSAPARLDGLHVLDFAGAADFIFVPGPPVSGPSADVGGAAPSESGEVGRGAASGPGPPPARSTGPGSGALRSASPLPPTDPEPSGTEMDRQPLGPLPDLGDEDERRTRATRLEFEMPPLPELENAGAPVDAPTGSARYALTVVEAGQTTRTWELEEGETVLGRDASCDIPVEDEWLSRAHAVLSVEGDRVTLRDRGSLNGTFVGEERTESAVLRPGDSFRLGPLTRCTLERR